MKDEHASKLLGALTELERKRKLEIGRERRNFSRIETRGEADLLAIDQSMAQRQLVSIQLRDVGWGGFGFICQEPLEPGSRWRALFLEKGQQVGEQTLMVRHCQAVGPALYLVGSQVCVDNGLVRLLGVDASRLGR